MHFSAASLTWIRLYQIEERVVEAPSADVKVVVENVDSESLLPPSTPAIPYCDQTNHPIVRVVSPQQHVQRCC